MELVKMIEALNADYKKHHKDDPVKHYHVTGYNTVKAFISGSWVTIGLFEIYQKFNALNN